MSITTKGVPLVRYYDIDQEQVDAYNAATGHTHLPGRYVLLSDLREAAAGLGMDDADEFLARFEPEAAREFDAEVDGAPMPRDFE